MFADNAQISHRQLFRQVVVGLLGIYFLAVPVLPGLFGRQGILALLTGMGIYLFLCIYFIRIKHIFQNPVRYMGKIPGRIFVLLYLSWLWMMGVYLLLMISGITERFLIENSVPWIIILLSGAAAYVGSSHGLERRGRMAEVCFPVLLVLVVGMLLLGILRVNPRYLQETGSLSLEGWVYSTYEVLCVFLPFTFLPITLGNVKKPGETQKAMTGAVCFLTGLLCLSLLLLQGNFGLGGYGHKEYPMIDFMAGVRIPGKFLERVDIFWTAGLMFSLLFGLGSVFFYSHELLERVKLKKTGAFVGAGILLAAEICRKMEVSTEFFVSLTVKVYGPLFLILLLYAGVAGKRKRMLWKTAVLLTATAFAASFLNGCGVSLEDRTFPLSMGADYEKGQYRLIYGIPGLEQITGQKKEDTENSQPQAIVYEGKTVEDAEECFDKNQENYLDLGHIKVLILGKGLLENRGALEDFLGYLEEKPSVAGNLYVFSCEDVPGIMSLEGEESVGEYLAGILENNPEGRRETAMTLQDLYNAWHRGEEMPTLISVTVVNNKPQIRQYS